MARHKKKGRKDRDARDTRIIRKDAQTNRPSAPDADGDWTLEWANDRFERYYKLQKIIGNDEWPAFMDHLRRTLPTTFRLPVGNAATISIVETIDRTYVPHLSEILFEDKPVNPPKKLPWYPDGLAYEIDVPKRVLRRSPDYKSFHQFLVYQTEAGNVSRQEAVSMIPPLLLDVQPHHCVLDACAAPGSKTAQLVEALHGFSAFDGSLNDRFVPYPSGLVIANDGDFARAQVLVHQAARLPSPALLVTNLDASNYPTLKTSNGRPLQFDRILCDVPCSGDGTLRKNVGIWKTWNIGSGNGLHNLQVRILLRAMQMLKPGGRIVYSTCSMNPIENEAVVATALNVHSGRYTLVPTDGLLPGLIRRPGLTHWTPVLNWDARGRTSEDPVIDQTPTTFDTFNAYLDSLSENEKKAGKLRLADTMWPPANAAELSLTECIRIYPHLQNTGAFFVAVIQKHSETDPTVRPKKRAVSPTSDSATSESKRLKTDITLHPSGEAQAPPTPNPAADNGTFKEHPFTFISNLDPILSDNVRRLNLVEEFPTANVFVRHHPTDLMKTFYLANDLVKTIIQNNEFRSMRLVSAGVKIFARHDLGPANSAPDDSAVTSEPSEHGDVQINAPRDRLVALRFVKEGINVASHFVQESDKIMLSLPDLRCFLDDLFPLLDNFMDPMKSILASKAVGSYIGVVNPGQIGANRLLHTLVLPLWRSGASASLMIDKQAKLALKQQLWGTGATTHTVQATMDSLDNKAEPPSQLISVSDD